MTSIRRMIEIKTRELSKKEKKELRNDKITSIIKDIENFVFTAGLIILIGLLPALVLKRYFIISSKLEGWYIIILFIISFISFLKIKRTIKDKNEKPLSEIQAEIITVKTSRAIKRKDPEDFGVAFYIDVRDKDNKRKTLFLWGQYLDMLEYEGKFPNTEFVIIRRDDTKYLMDIIVKGTFFRPEKIIEPFNDELWTKGEVPNDGDILQYSIDEVKE